MCSRQTIADYFKRSLEFKGLHMNVARPKLSDLVQMKGVGLPAATLRLFPEAAWTL